MRMTRLWPAVLLATGLFAAPAFSQIIYCSPALYRPLGRAPSIPYAPHFYWANHLGAVYGPNYWLRPPFPPEQGIGPACYGLPPISSLPHLKGRGRLSFPVHRFVRSPRDFFMWGEAYANDITRLRHPSLVP